METNVRTEKGNSCALHKWKIVMISIISIGGCLFSVPGNVYGTNGWKQLRGRLGRGRKG